MTMRQVIVNFLATKGRSGATMAEIYAGVQEVMGDTVIDSSVRAAVYRRLSGAKSKYLPLFERAPARGKKPHYRLLTFGADRRL